MTKLVTKPFEPGNPVGKSRDVSGLRKWSRDSRGMGRIMRVLGWFTIPAEVFMRRRFGQRWFTPMNFVVGAFLIAMVVLLQYGWDKVRYFFSNFESTFNPFYGDVEQEPFAPTTDMLFALALYLIFGILHLISIWWREKTNAALHSYDDGTSHFAKIGRMVVWVLNGLARPFIHLYMVARRKKGEGAVARPKFIDDPDAFTHTVIEPLVCFWMAYSIYNGGGHETIPALWMFITGFAVAIYANGKETARKSKLFDFRDARLEAQAMRELRMGKSAAKAKQAAKGNKPPIVVANATASYPDLTAIIEELHRQRNPTI